MLWQSVNILIFEVEIGFIADLIDLLTARVVFSDLDKGITLHDMVELIASHEGGEEAEEGNNRKLISFKSDGESKNEREITSA